HTRCYRDWSSDVCSSDLFFRELVIANALQQQVVIANALRSADDLAVALGRQHVNAERQLRTLRIRLHVKRLHLRRVTMDHDRLKIGRASCRTGCRWRGAL